MSRRGKAWAIAAIVSVLGVVAAAVLAPIPFVTRSPGPVFDLLGSVPDDPEKPVLQIGRAESYPTTGVLDMTTVAESGGSAGAMNVGAALVGLFQSSTSVLPDERPDVAEDRQVQEAIFDESQSQALGAAATFLNRPLKSSVIVLQVISQSASAGVLEPGDVLLAVDGTRVSDRAEVATLIAAQPVGSRIELRIRRDGTPRRVSVVSRAAEGDPQRPVIGIVPENRYRSDFTATVNLAGIGGPSAGLMLTVGIIDKLTPGDQLQRRRIAGTGTMTADGAVGPIGGIDKKMIAAADAGAELFLAPADNCDEVRETAPPGLPVAAVATLDEAMAAIKTWQSGAPPPQCPPAGP